MVILALETATTKGSVALCVDDECVGRQGEDARTHGERLPGELIDWLRAQGRRLDEVDAFAVVTGPGSFTGLRVGVAAIQGLALAGHRRVVAIPTLEAMAAAWLTTEGASPPIIVPCLDGQRGDVFVAAFDATGAAAIEDCRVLIEPRVSRPPDIGSALASLAPSSDLVLVGNGARTYAAVFEQAVPGVRIADVPTPHCRSRGTDSAHGVSARRSARTRFDRSISAGPMPSSRASAPPAARVPSSIANPTSGRSASLARAISRPSRRCSGARSRTRGAPRRSSGSSRTRTSRGCT